MRYLPTALLRQLRRTGPMPPRSVRAAPAPPPPPPPYPPYLDVLPYADPQTGALVIIDTLNPATITFRDRIPAFLSNIISAAVSVVAGYHTDMPLAPAFKTDEPDPLDVLCHLATAIIRVSSLFRTIEQKKARDRGLPEPNWGPGLLGMMVGDVNKKHDLPPGVVVLDMEIRRKSGRAEVDKFVLWPGEKTENGVAPGNITLLSDHPLMAAPTDLEQTDGGSGKDAEDTMETTFDLGLTDKQRKDREAVVPPYFDAQTNIGSGEGGRILYEMSREDDFDEEEDDV